MREQIRLTLVMFLWLTLVLSFPLATRAQTPKMLEIKPNKVGRFKLKLTRDLTSGRVRVGDYVQFELIEDVKYPYDGGLARDTIIVKGTPVFGKVVDRRHRFTAIKKGRFSVGELSTTTVDGREVKLVITRPDMPVERCVNKIPEKRREAERKAARYSVAQNVDGNEERQDARKEAHHEEQNAGPVPCVNGRVYAGSLISNLPSALLAVATATLLARVKDNATDAVVAVTLADKLASQSGLSNIINGVDAEMGKDEIFEATISIKEPLVINVLPSGTPATASTERVGRFAAPTPPGYIITDYFSDVVNYPSTSGQPGIYTGKVIDRYTDKPVGSKMIMCESQNVPDGWVIIDRKVDAKFCPREPGDTVSGPNYSVILKTGNGMQASRSGGLE